MKIKLDEGAYMPERAYPTDAGLDLKTPIAFCVPARGSAVVSTGVHVELPENTVGILKSKSGLNVKFNINNTGTIDQNYRGAIVVKLYNHGDTDVVFSEGQKISQLVIFPVIIPDKLELVDELGNTDRGSNGFGSSGS